MSGARLWSFVSGGRRGRSFVYLILLSAGAGCASRGNTELLEANLRQYQDRIASYERQVSSLRGELAASRAETDQLRRELVALGKEGRQEATEPLAQVAGIQFNSMMTGARDSDGEPGHDVITAVLAPHDQHGDLVKLGGQLEFEVLDLSRPADQQRIGSWKYTPEQARELWHSGFLASGFQLDLPIGGVHKSGNVILHGRLVTADGRQFDTTCPVALVSADSVASAPRALPMPRQSRPVSAAAAKGFPGATGNARVLPASAETREEEPNARSEPAAMALLDEAPEVPAVSRPVPSPVDPPQGAALPVVRPGNTPRPFPGASAPQENSSPRPFPGDRKTAGALQTSDNWTEESIPFLR